MKRQLTFILFGILSIICTTYSYASLFPETSQSYAQQYKQLRILLQKVDSTESAIDNKGAIENQIRILNSNQTSGSEYFNTLSSEDKKLFIKKFQNNRFHCGEVTEVMVERQRILLNSDLANILRDTLSEIP